MATRMIDTVGGEQGLRQLVEEFYDLVEILPEGEVRSVQRSGPSQR
jgi:truncated hemoglobin YjbI